ncbi:4-alpha-glucanotransferase [Algiphilus sp. W345]|uniref:4-alpha-glucanotransferase n=2 Tax=Banduia mediterranea TaxID=3075609 RepID=A0ABU2WI58_9GAMM|nr:4-alpha-glucanotransferase [Algiphilus sp. W345]MDT0496966.1 4-alpha-glucanotransferase [Algiphilus sp. W345]
MIIPTADPRLRIVLGWHMHQPEYRDPASGEFRLPWTYLHAIKDYADMAAHLEQHPQARAVVNFVPLLLEQIEDYAQRIERCLNDGQPIGDETLDLLLAASIPADADVRRRAIEHCLRAHPERLIGRYPVYRRLAAEALRLLDHDDELRATPEVFFTDLATWYHLAWTGEAQKRQDRFIQSLIAQNRIYTVAQRRELLRLYGECMGGLVPRYRALAESGRVELSLTPYGHPIVPLLLDIGSAQQAMPQAPLPSPPHYPGGQQRSRWHFAQALDAFKQRFGFIPQGVWCSEGGVSDATLDLLGEFDFSWTVTGQGVLGHSGADDPHRPYTVGGRTLACFFRDDGLSDAIGFKYSNWHADDAAADLVAHLESIAAQARAAGDAERVVTIYLDGENAWEYFPDNGYHFLDALYARLEDHPQLRMQTFSDIVAQAAPRASLPRLVAGSWVYGTFSTWIGSADKNRGWERLIEAKQAFDQKSHALDEASLARAERQLAVCEGSDWFWWFGDDNPASAVASFDRLYRQQLERLYDILGLPAPANLEQALSRGGGAAAAGGTMKAGSADDQPPPIAPDQIAPAKVLMAARGAGVLLHISSLPDAPGNGDFSHSAYRFIEFCAEAGFDVWQLLPLGATHEDGSPYLSLSANAGNPLLISLDWLVDHGWLPGYEATADDAKTMRREALVAAWHGFQEKADAQWRVRFDAFRDAQADWLDDYCLFAALNAQHGGRSWIEWPQTLRDREASALSEAKGRLDEQLQRIAFEQFVFFTQWHEIRDYAQRHDVRLFGDLPLFVAHHSADVWAHRELFHVDAHGQAELVAGVPPDYFAEDGQIWGNPLYRWSNHEREGYAWWVRRMRTQWSLFDIVRIDHFRGLSAYWELKAGSQTARGGRWVPAPGDALLTQLHRSLYPLNLVAEDLGEITPDVYELRDRHHLPGMRVLQFAFDGDPNNLHLPQNTHGPLLMYTGTHDNNTTCAWWEELDPATQDYARFYLLHPEEPMPWPMIHTALASTAPLAIVPMQDLLGLGAEARMNTPGTVENNWSWRFEWSQLPGDLRARLRELIQRYGRLGDGAAGPE